MRVSRRSVALILRRRVRGAAGVALAPRCVACVESSPLERNVQPHLDGAVRVVIPHTATVRSPRVEQEDSQAPMLAQLRHAQAGNLNANDLVSYHGAPLTDTVLAAGPVWG